MPQFYIFPTKHPLCRVSAGNGTGGGALDKVGRDCYHKNRKSAVTSGWLSVSANNIMLTVQLPLGGQHAFMESASAKNTTHSRNFKKNLSIPASPPSNVDFARG